MRACVCVSVSVCWCTEHLRAPLLQYLPLSVCPTQRASLPERFPWEARLSPRKTGQVPANSGSGRDRAGEKERGRGGPGPVSRLPQTGAGSPGCGQGPAPGARSVAHGQACPSRPPPLHSEGTEEWRSLSPLPPDFGLSRFLYRLPRRGRGVRAGWRCRHSCPSLLWRCPGILTGKRRQNHRASPRAGPANATAIVPAWGEERASPAPRKA